MAPTAATQATLTPEQVRTRIVDIMRALHAATTDEQRQAARDAKRQLLDELERQAFDARCSWDDVVRVEGLIADVVRCEAPTAVIVTTVRDYGPGALTAPRIRRVALCRQHGDEFSLVTTRIHQALIRSIDGATADLSVREVG